MKYDISFVGLGKLGLPLATNFAKKGKKVLAIDLNPQLLEYVKQGKAPWVETDLQSNIDKASPNITYTNSYNEVTESEYSIILVNTPSKSKDGSFSNEYIISALTSICLQLKKNKKPNHKFILSSTVMPGSIKNEFIPLINNILGWELDNQYTFSYVPDFVAIGDIIENFHKPDFVLIGSSNPNTGHEVHKLYSCMLHEIVPTSFLTLAEGELAKVALNAYITTKISFANYLGLLSEKIDPDINVDNITSAIGQDKRIGKKYFTAGGPYGGTCFPRDTWAYLQVSNKVGMFAEQMAANEKINNNVLDNISSKLLGNKKIGLVGLGFKPGTSVVTEGIAAKLLKLNKFPNSEIYVYDTFKDSVSSLLEINSDIIPTNNLTDLYSKVDVVLFCNGDKTYDTSNIPSNLKIVDPWRTI
jgi:UDPglucose 6-dehydrogenase